MHGHADRRTGSIPGERLDACDRVASIWLFVDLGLDAFGATPVARHVEHGAHRVASSVNREFILVELQTGARVSSLPTRTAELSE